jgi:hypothetical protein
MTTGRPSETNPTWQTKPSSRILVLTLPEFLRGHAQGAVELAGGILPGDDGRQLYNRVVRVELAQPREQLVRHLAPRDRHRVGVQERDFFGLCVERARRVVRERQDFLVRGSEFAAHGSVDVLSKLAAVD